MREKLLLTSLKVLLLALAVAAGRNKEEHMKAEEAVYFPIVVDSKANSYQILNDSFLREKLEYVKESDKVDGKSQVRYEVIPLKDLDLKMMLPVYSTESTNIRPHQIKSVSYKDTSLNEKYKVYTGFLPNEGDPKYKEETPKYYDKYPPSKDSKDYEVDPKPYRNSYPETLKYDIDNYASKVNNRYRENPKESEDYTPKYSVTEKPKLYQDPPKYPEAPKRDSYKDSLPERYTENPKPYLEAAKRYPENPRKESYQDSLVQRYTENPKPYLESVPKRYQENPKKDSYPEPPVERYTENPKPYLENKYPKEPQVERYTENPKSYSESLRYPEILKEESYKKTQSERYPDNPKPYVENTTPKSHRYSENPKPEIDPYTSKPLTSVGYPIPGNRYTENPKVIVESYTPKPYGDQYSPPRYVEEKPKPAAIESYAPKPYTESPKSIIRYTENPRPVESYTTKPEKYPVRYTENPKPIIDTYTPKPYPEAYKPPHASAPANRYPEVPARYTENPKPAIESYTSKPYADKPRPSTYTTPNPRPLYAVKYPDTPQRYTENPKPAVDAYTPPSVVRYTENLKPITKGYLELEKSKYGSYSTTPAYQKPYEEHRPPAHRYEKRPAGYKPLYGSNQQDGYEIYVPEEYDDDYSAIPGKPGIDYPIFDIPPYTNFNCADQEYAGYYADVEARCQVFHICQADGRANAFLCPNGTQFNQQFFVCDWWYNVNCEYAPALYSLNAHLYETPYRHSSY